MTTHEITLLESLDACPEGVEYAKQHPTLPEAVRHAQRSYALWAVYTLCTAQDRVRIACHIARHTPIGDGRTVWDLLTDERSRAAIETAERWAEGKATDEELSAARCAAAAATYAADAAVAAAYAAVDAAYAAVDADDDDDAHAAATYAADAAVAAAAAYAADAAYNATATATAAARAAAEYAANAATYAAYIAADAADADAARAWQTQHLQSLDWTALLAHHYTDTTS